MSLACIGWSWCVGTGGWGLRAARPLERVSSASAPQDRFCGPPDPSIHQLSALESPMQPKGAEKEGQMSKVRLYGNFTEVRSNFSMPLKLIPTVVVTSLHERTTISRDRGKIKCASSSAIYV